LTESQKKYSNWKPTDFEALVLDGKVFDIEGDRAVPSSINVEELPNIIQNDTKLMTNYGRPYGEDLKPSIGFYSLPKTPVLKDFNAKL